jgi:DNA mismatch repair protein MutS
VTYSPLIEQYLSMKARHPEAIVLARVGDFYEAYGDDAETIAALLQIALTSKEAGNGRRIAMAGVPHHALEQYLAKLVAQQRIVALAEQLEPPVPNRLTKRDVVRVVTPGTLIEEHLLERTLDNYLASVAVNADTFGIAHADVSTGRVAATAFTGERAWDETIAELVRIAPAEIVADVPREMRSAIELALPGVRITSPPIAPVIERDRQSIVGCSVDESLAVHRALDGLTDFVRRVGIGDAALRSPSLYRASALLTIDANARKHLELTKALGANPKATLLATLDRCKTAMGSRLLARRLTAPLVERAAIETRQDEVAALINDYPARSAIAALLAQTFDLERVAQKVRIRKAGPRDLGSLRRTLAVLDPLRAAVPAPLRGLAGRIADLAGAYALLERMLVDEPPALLSDGNVIRPEASPELQACVALRTDARARLGELEERERARTGIKTLKVKYASAFGYAIEVSKSNLAAVPADYVRKQTLTNAERFVTPELKELEIAIGGAQTQQQRLEEALYATVIDELAQQVEAMLETADALAEIDVAASLAFVAAERGYVRPSFVEQSTIDIRDGRHPVMERLVGDAFVPNDLALARERSRFLLITGPNMGGKSTYLRQTALLVILAQIGSFVPARSMALGVVDRIFTRIGAGDDLASGQSTFYVEMLEASSILRKATSRSLLLIDEVGRGTGTTDGLAIAQSICEYLLEFGSSAPMVLFATHFHELVALAEEWPTVENVHVTAVENTARSGAPVFSHRVLPGSTSRSFGIEVATMAGLPPGVIARAREIAEALGERPAVEAQAPLRRRISAPDRREETQLSLEL